MSPVSQKKPIRLISSAARLLCWTAPLLGTLACQPVDNPLATSPSQPSMGVNLDQGMGVGPTDGAATTPAELPGAMDPSGGGPPADPVSYTVEAGGFIRSGLWQGAAWVGVDAIGTSISPMTFEGVPAGGPLCIQGSVIGDAAYGGFAAIGVNLNQASPEAAILGANPDGDGILIDVTNNAENLLRVQIEGTGGASDPSQRWCASLGKTSTAGPVQIRWEDFAYECWDGGAKTPYDRTQPIERILIQVPGDDVAATPSTFA